MKKEYGACTSGKCVIYVLNTNVSNSWQYGHIISHNNGGPTTLDNLRPLCAHVIEIWLIQIGWLWRWLNETRYYWELLWW